MREGIGLVLLFLFAIAVFGFVAFVWQYNDDQPIHNGDTPTLPPGVIPCCPVPTTAVPAP